MGGLSIDSGRGCGSGIGRRDKRESTESATATAKKINVRAINFALCRRCANKGNKEKKKKQIIITAAAHAASSF